MTTATVPTPVPAEGTPAPSIPSPTTSGDSPSLDLYEQIARIFLKSVEAALTEIGVLGQRQASSMDAVRVLMQVPDSFIETAITAVAMEPGLGVAPRFDLEAARDSARYRAAFMKVLTHWDIWRRDIKFSMDVRKAPVAASALKVYAVAKSVSTGSTGMAPDHADNLRRELGRSNPQRRKAATEPPSGTPQS